MQDKPPQIGQRVYYRRENPAAQRNGWTGTVVPTTNAHADFAVEWDQAKRHHNPTNYILQASGQYVHDLEDETDADADTYLVAGENGGDPKRVRGYGKACRQAERAARESRSGQRYIVYAPAEAYRRQPPPVERETFDTPGGKAEPDTPGRTPGTRDIRWDRVPPGFAYVAMDHNRTWWAYRNAPKPNADSLQWAVTGYDTAHELGEDFGPPVDAELWDRTLVRRPYSYDTRGERHA